MEQSSGRPEGPTTEADVTDVLEHGPDLDDPNVDRRVRDAVPSPVGYEDTVLSDPDRRPRNIDPLDPRMPSRENNDPLDPDSHVI